MSLTKASEIEVGDEFRIKHKGMICNAVVTDIEYRPRALILHLESDAGVLEIGYAYDTLIDLIGTPA